MRTDTGDHGDPHLPNIERRTTWIALLVASALGFSLFFACATPFAALATVAALKMPQRDAGAVIGLVWLGNQAIGYGMLRYPWTLNSAAWGVAIGISGLLALLVAMALSPTRHSAPLAISLSFVGAFATHELALYIAAFMLSDGEAGFTAPVVEHVLLINLVALVGLLAAHHVALMTGLLSQKDRPQGIAAAS